MWKSFVFVLLLGVCAAAELPPLPAEARRAQATCIVVGKVRKTTTLLKSGPKGWSDSVTISELQVIQVEKGGDQVRVGDVVLCSYWKADHRPQGWVGPGGQYTPLPEGKPVRVFLEGAQGGIHTLLTPNGWESLSQ